MSAWKTTVPKKSDNGDFPDRYCPEEGPHPAVLVGIIDLGTHKEEYGGKEKDTHKLLLVWELAGLKEPGTQIPVTIGRDYTFSLNEKSNLAKMIGGWRGKALAEGEEFDLTVMLGKPCLLTVSHKTSKEAERVYAVVSGISPWKGPLVAGKPLPKESVNKLAWTFGDGPAADLPGWVPFFCALGQVKEVIAGARENRKEPASNGAKHTSRGPTPDREDANHGFPEPAGPPPADDTGEIPF